MVYRKIETRIWDDQWFRGLSRDAKLVFIFVLTHPSMTAMGCMRVSEAAMADDIGMEPKAFREAFREALAKGSVMASWDDRFLCVPNFLRYNRPESPNVVKSWGKLIDTLPECDLRDAYFSQVKAFVEGFGEGFRKALPEPISKASGKGMPNQEQEQEQEQKQEVPPSPPTGGKSIETDGPVVSSPQNKATSKQPQKSILLERFARYWAAYPRKTGKKKAEAIWLKIKPSEALLTKMLETLEWQTSSEQWTKDDGQFIPMPTTWLNQGRWDDEPPRGAKPTIPKISTSESAQNSTAELVCQTCGWGGGSVELVVHPDFQHHANPPASAYVCPHCKSDDLQEADDINF